MKAPLIRAAFAVPILVAAVVLAVGHPSVTAGSYPGPYPIPTATPTPRSYPGPAPVYLPSIPVHVGSPATYPAQTSGR